EAASLRYPAESLERGISDPSTMLGSIWKPQGPAGTSFGQVENIPLYNSVVGAVHALLTHPTDPDILYIGATNGGLWRTDTATSFYPTWTPLSDSLHSLSIGAMAFDTADA